MASKGFGLLAIILILLVASPLFGADPLPDESVGSREFISRAQLPGEIPITEAPFVIRIPGQYVLMNDIEAEASAITILVSNVVLDLNGHTITYGNGSRFTSGDGIATYNGRQSGNVGHSGILAPGSPDRTQDIFPNNHPEDALRENLIIRNGRIRSGRGQDLAYAPAIDAGGFSNSTISDVVIDIDADDSEALIIGPRSMISHCTINHTGKVVSAPDIGLAAVTVGKGTEVRFCHFTDGPQTIICTAGHAEIHHNVMRYNAKVPNGYAIRGVGEENVRIHDNKIMTANGHGILVSVGDAGWEIFNNYIEVSILPEDTYLSIEAHGIRMEKTVNANVSHNQVVCYTAPGGQPAPLSLALTADSGNVIRGNIFAALSLHPGTGCYGAYLSDSDGAGSMLSDNAFYLSADSDSSAVNVSWTGAQNHTFRNSQFRRLGSRGGLAFMRMHTGPDANGHNQRFVDCTFQAGISPRSRRVVARSGGSYQVAYSFRIETLAGVEVEIFDKNGIPVEMGSTDDKGHFEVELDAFMVEISGRTSNILKLAPYTIRAANYDVSREIVVDPIGPMEWILDLDEIQMDYGNSVILTPTRPPAGMVDETYQLKLNNGSLEKGRWQLAKGELPPGLILRNRTIYGTPKESGAFPITLLLETSDGSVEKPILITIKSKTNPYWRERVSELLEANGQAPLEIGKLLYPPKKKLPRKQLNTSQTSSKVVFHKVPIF